MTMPPHLHIAGKGDAAAGLSGAVLFAILWEELADLLGSAATAALLRRAARRAAQRSQELAQLSIARVDEQFGFVVPESFAVTRGPCPALRELLDELRPLLEEATGPIALQRLAEVPALRSWTPAPPPRP
jgi:hypothetical protein